MIFDYQGMIKEAEKTGQPVTRTSQLGCYDDTSATVAEKTIDTTAIVAPITYKFDGNTISFSDDKCQVKALMQRTHHHFQAPRYANLSNIASERVDEILRQLDRSGIPACMREINQAGFYASLVTYYFFTLSDWAKSRIIRAVGGNDADSKFWQPHAGANDCLPWVTKGLNRGPVISALVLGNLMDVKPELCFSAFPEAAQQRVQYALEASVVDATPKSLVVSGTNFKRMHIDIQRDLNGSITQAVCQKWVRKTGP